MTDKTYNGWANRATWLVSLWSDEYGWSEDFSRCTTKDEAKDLVLDALDFDSLKGLVAEMVADSIADVNWQEILDHYKGEYSDEETEE